MLFNDKKLQDQVKALAEDVIDLRREIVKLRSEKENKTDNRKMAHTEKRKKATVKARKRG